MDITPYRIDNGDEFHLEDHDPNEAGGLQKGKQVKKALKRNLKRLKLLQEMLYAHNRYGLLIILQAMDAAGKDGLIKHVMTGLNPQGVQVRPFKAPSEEEKDHDYLWRAHQHTPARGNIAIFNRSYYEDVVIVRMHDLLLTQNMPEERIEPTIWQDRHRHIREFEQYMNDNGFAVVKIYLNLSKDEQRERLLSRIDNPDKQWKFSSADIEERLHWDRYQETYEEVIRATATPTSPWFVVPADRKWFSRLLFSNILIETLQQLPIQFPELEEEQRAMLDECRDILTDDS